VPRPPQKQLLPRPMHFAHVSSEVPFRMYDSGSESRLMSRNVEGGRQTGSRTRQDRCVITQQVSRTTAEAVQMDCHLTPRTWQGNCPELLGIRAIFLCWTSVLFLSSREDNLIYRDRHCVFCLLQMKFNSTLLLCTLAVAFFAAEFQMVAADRARHPLPIE
jgi:hypothetical protein